MKIVKFEDFNCDGGWDNYCFLKITTDDGLVGWSEYSERRGRRGLTSLIHSLGSTIVGEDPRNLNFIDAALQTQIRSTPAGVTAHAVGAIMNALLDIKAKALGVPCYDLLGGAIRRQLPVYWSRCGVVRATQAAFFDGKVIDKPAVRRVEDLVAAGREARDRGFPALKCNLLVFDDKGGRVHTPGSARMPGFPELNVDERLVDALVAQLSALREGAGPDVRLIVDLNFNYKPEGFRRLARAVEPFNLMWLEMDIYDPHLLAGVRRSTTTPIGSLEAILGRRALKPYLEAQSADVAIIDTQYNGVPESYRMASLCDLYDVNVASHAFAGPLSVLMSAHLCAAIPNFRIMEMDIDAVPWRMDFLTHPFKIENGVFHLPEGPGWGSDINEEVVRARLIAQ